VAQATSPWRNLVNLLQALPLEAVSNSVRKQIPWRRWQLPGGWVLVGGGTLGLLFWNGRLVIATGIGVAIMMLVYVFQDSKWKPWTEVQKILEGWNSQFLLAAASGGTAMLGTYMASSIWVEAEHHWIATGMILQGTATFGLLGLVIWQMMGQKRDRTATKVDHLLSHLTDPDPLKRLIAVRQLIEAMEHREHPVQHRHYADYLRVMLSREEDAIVRDSILEGLQILQDDRSLPPTRLQPLEPAKLKPKVKVQKQPTF
jgi:hypothetical protein